MRHAAILLATLLMLGDYYLSLLAARLAGLNHAERAAFELNPMYKAAVADGRLFHLGHLTVVAAVTASLAYLAQSGRTWLLDATLGALVGALVPICGTHIAGILVQLHLRRHPEDAAGHRQGTERLRLTTSAYFSFGATALLALVTAQFVPTPFTVGAAIGALSISLSALEWRRRIRSRTEPEPAGASPRCSFCGRDAHSVERIVAGDDAAICNVCVTRCVETLAEASASTSSGSGHSSPSSPGTSARLAVPAVTSYTRASSTA